MTFLDSASVLQSWINSYAIKPLLILFLGIFLGKLLEQLLLFIFSQLGVKRYTYTFSAYVMKWAVYVLSIGLALLTTGFLSFTLWFLAAVLILVACASIVLGVLNFFPNFAHYHRMQAQYKPDTKIKTRFGDGVVVKVELSDVHVKTTEGDDLFIPNRSVKGFLEK